MRERPARHKDHAALRIEPALDTGGYPAGKKVSDEEIAQLSIEPAVFTVNGTTAFNQQQGNLFCGDLKLLFPTAAGDFYLK